MVWVPVHELKRRLSAYLRRAASGERIVVTLHNRPIAALGRAAGDVHAGARFGRASLASALRRATRGRYLEVLRADRADR